MTSHPRFPAIIAPILDLLGVTSFALCIILGISLYQKNLQLNIYEYFVVKCLNGHWIVNGQEAVKCIRI